MFSILAPLLIPRTRPRSGFALAVVVEEAVTLGIIGVRYLRFVRSGQMAIPFEGNDCVKGRG